MVKGEIQKWPATSRLEMHFCPRPGRKMLFQQAVIFEIPHRDAKSCAV
jgi:hypothetical protein